MSPDTPVNPVPSPGQILLVHDEQLKTQAEMLATMHKNLNHVMEYLKNLPVPTVNPAPASTTKAPPPDPGITDDRPAKRNAPKFAIPPDFMSRDDKFGFITWSFKLRKYFGHYPLLSEKERVDLATGYFTGPAFTWFIHAEKTGKVFHDLNELLEGLKSICNLNDDENKDEDTFHDLQQTGSVADYVTAFEELRLRLNDVGEPEAIRKFLGGLKPHVKKSLRREAAHLRSRLTLEQAMELALVEDPTPAIRNRPPIRNAPVQTSNADPRSMDLDALDARGNLRSLTDAQRKFLRERNRCFAYRQIGHRPAPPAPPC